MPKISASILSADFAILKDQVCRVVDSGADYLHIDVMDGVFVPNITVGPKFVHDIARHAKIPLDVHLMIINPDRYIRRFIDAGASMITVHIEAIKSVQNIAAIVKEYDVLMGVSISPETHPSALDLIYQYVDLILVMTVKPGFAGQTFLYDQLAKITHIKRQIDLSGNDILLSVDGGINDLTGKECSSCGADILVAGSYIFGHDDYRDAISALKI